MPKKVTATALMAAVMVWLEKTPGTDEETKWVLLIALVVYMVLHAATDMVAMVYKQGDDK